MKKSSVVVGRQSWFDARLWLAVAAAALVVVGYLMYDLGLSRAGFLRSQTSAAMDKLERANAQLTATNKQLSERVAILETAAKVDREAYRQVDAELAALQSQIIKQQEDIEFYRGIVGEDDGSALRIQSFSVQALRDREFELRLVLAQTLRLNREISGVAKLSIEGIQGDERVTLSFADLGGKGDSLKYAFLYFQELKAAVVLPDGFEPLRVRVLLVSKGKSVKTVEEFFDWQQENG